VWRGRRAPTVVGLDIDGKAVAEAALGLGRSPLGALRDEAGMTVSVGVHR